MRSIRFLAAAALLTAAFTATSASAVSIDYDVAQGSQPQFQFSFLHAATSNCCGAPPQYNNNGTKLFRLDGVITADWDSVTERAELLADVSLTATVLDASVPGGSVGEVWTLDLLAGSHLERAPNGRAQGLLDYELRDLGANLVASGTFYVFPEDVFPPLVNRVGLNQFTAWANNWENGVDPVPTGDFFSALGIDLVAVPAPPEALLFALGAAGLYRRGRRLPGGRAS